MRAKREAGDGRILTGDNIGGCAVVLRPIKFQCAGVWVSNGLALINIHVQSSTRVLSSELRKIRLVPELPERNYCPVRGVSLQAHSTFHDRGRTLCANWSFQSIRITTTSGFLSSFGFNMTQDAASSFQIQFTERQVCLLGD